MTTMTKEELARLEEQRKAAYEKLVSQYEKEVATWDDFYGAIRKRMAEFQKCHCPMHMADALYTMFAFIVTMEECPDEGDIKKLMQHMCRMIVYEGEQKLGTQFLLDVSDGDRMVNANRLAQMILGGNIFGALRARDPAGEEAEVVSPDAPQGTDKPDPKKLH